MSRTLFAGPFVGEFGMELFTWQGHIRNFAKEFNATYVSSRPQNEFLYKDFCQKFIPYSPPSYNCDGYECDDLKNVPNLHEGHNANRVIRTIDLQSYVKEIRGTPQKFYSYKKEAKETGIDICICARSFKRGAETKLQRNWDLNDCKKFVDEMLRMGFSVASVGLTGYSEHIEGTVNKMDISLEELSGVLSSSKMIVGPSAGVMHFATLCECPQVVWGELHLRKRYEEEWNPFNTKVTYIDSPNYDVTYKDIINFLN